MKRNLNPQAHRFRPFARLKGLLAHLFTGSGSGEIGSAFSSWPFLPGSGYDYKTEAGMLWDNSIVLAGIGWIAATLPESELGVGTIGGKDVDEKHPAARLISTPNCDYNGANLWAGTVLSLLTDGNAYWRKVRDRTGQVKELWYVPHYRIEPVWPTDGSEFISGYRMSVDSSQRVLPKRDVLHFRHHILDPLNERKGLSPLKAALREICTDNESATYTAALLRNSGVPGALISPEPRPGDSQDLVFEKQQREDLAALWRAKFTGDHRGEPLVVPVPMKVQQFSFNPQQMLVDKVTDRPEERICALLNIPPVVLNLGTGLKNTNNRASYSEARRAAYESNIVPTQERIARELTHQLLVEFDPGRDLTFRWDRSAVEILRESEDAKFVRAGQAFRDGYVTINEARGLVGLQPLEGGDRLYGPNGQAGSISE